MEILFFIIVKFLLYFLVAYWAVPMFAIKVASPVKFGLFWGTARLVVGVASIFLIGLLLVPLEFMGFANNQTSSFYSYVVIFGIVRCLSWYYIFTRFAKVHGLVFNKRVVLWIGIGVLISFAVDYVAFFLGLDNLKFVC